MIAILAVAGRLLVSSFALLNTLEVGLVVTQRTWNWFHYCTVFCSGERWLSLYTVYSTSGHVWMGGSGGRRPCKARIPHDSCGEPFPYKLRHLCTLCSSDVPALPH